MLTETQVFEQFAPIGIVAEGGEIYIPKREVSDFIDLCESNQLAVIGVEGLIYEDGKFIPQLDLIADYSSSRIADWTTYMETCNSAARAFIESAKSRENLYFTFVVLSPQEIAK
jgi:hypothetical protein